jgi:putative oxidoreductase
VIDELTLWPRDLLALAGRLLLATLFLHEGVAILQGYAGAGRYIEQFGVPALLLPAVIALQIGAGLCLAAGWQTRLAAIALACFCVAAALIFHRNIAVRNELLHFEKDLAIAGGLMALAALGAGRWSIDHR